MPHRRNIATVYSKRTVAIVIAGLLCAGLIIAYFLRATPRTATPRQDKTPELMGPTLKIPEEQPRLAEDAPVYNSSELQPCTGNPSDQCKATPAVDFFPRGSEDASNDAFTGSFEDMKSIMGRVIAIGTESVTIKSTSGRSFTIVLPSGAIATFNQHMAAYYAGSMQLAMGDALYVDYVDNNPDRSVISLHELFRSNLLIQDFDKKDVTGARKKY